MTRPLSCGSAITSISLAIAASSGFLALEAPSAHAYTVLQSFADTYTLNPIPFGNSTAYGPPSTFTVLPFDASLGSLLSTTITWETSGAGVATASSNGGALTLANGGATLVNSSTYGGYGLGVGGGAAPNQLFSVTLPANGLTTTFLPANVGAPDDPAIWAAFTGLSPFSLRYLNPSIPGPYAVTYTTVSGSATITTTASVAYNYAPVPGPLALLMAPAAWSWSRRLRTRQVGKTTLALQLTETLPSLDLDLESTALRQRFTCRRSGRNSAGQGHRSG
jgi:hypothetical protein